jgi:3-hydroxyacyl-CoA dehydrogenase
MPSDWEQQLIRRFTLATFLEAVRLFEEGIAAPEDVDLAMRAGAGLAEGPFHWADARGLDVVLEELEMLAAEAGPRFQPPASLRARVQRGQLGVRTGRGYMTYVRRSRRQTEEGE